MISMRVRLGLSLLFACLLLSCQQEPVPCMETTELGNDGHLTDISSLQTDAPEFLDSINAYPQLQVAKLMQQGENLRMDCNVFHENVRLFFASYNLLKNRTTGSIHAVGRNQVSYALNIDLAPSIPGADAVAAARQEMDFGISCLTYTLGVIEDEAGAYVLIWFVAPEENAARFVMLDAQTNEVLRVVTGTWE